MSYPFRRPATDESDNSGIPNFFTKSNEAPPTKMPDFFTKEGEEPKKPSVFSKIKKALGPDLTHKPVDTSKIKEAKTDEEIKAEAEHPTYYDPTHPPTHTNALSQFVDTVKGALTSDKEPTTFLGGFLKGMKKELTPTKEGIKQGLMEQLQSAAHPQTLGDFLTLVGASEAPGAGRGEIPIRQQAAESAVKSASVPPKPATFVPRGKEIPYRASAADIAADAKAQADSAPPIRQKVTEFIKNNPEAKIADVKNFMDSVTEAQKPMKEFSAKDILSEMTTNELERLSKIRGTAEDIPDTPQARALEAARTGKPLEEIKSKAPSPKEAPNPFEKTEEAPATETPKYFVAQKGDVQPSAPLKTIDITDATKTPESLHPDLTSLKNYGDGVVNLDFAKEMKPEEVKALFPDKDVQVTDLSSKSMPNHFRLDFKDPQAADDAEQSIGGAFDKAIEMHGGLGGVGGGSKVPEPFKGPNGPVLDKLFTALQDAKSNVGEQEAINRATRAQRFAEFSSVKQEGAAGAAKSLGKLRGEFEKVEPGEALGLKPEEADSLFTAVKKANITPAEKARGYTALFKLMSGEGTPVRSDLRVLDSVFGNNFGDKIIEMHGGLGAVGLKVSKVANTMKSLQNSVSLAAPLRHGIGLAYRKEFGPAFMDMFRFFGKKDYYNAGMKAIEDSPNYLLKRDAGLAIIKPNSLLDSDEEFLNSYVGNIPVARTMVAASQRAYTGFLNKLRSDVFDTMTKQAEKLGTPMSTKVGEDVVATKEAKAIAKFINNATGRGDLGSLNKMTNELNTLFWSPRMIASRVNMLANPKMYMDLPKGMRLEGLKSLLGIAALGTTIDTLAAYAGAKVSTNILSTDFGKSRFGIKLIDPWGGLQQYVVGAARFLAGKTDSPRPTDRLSIAGRFLQNKLSPAASLADTLLTAKPTKGGAPGDITTQYGEKTSVQSQIGKQFVPIFIQDLTDLAKSDPDWSDSIGLTAALAGASVAGMEQSYPQPKTSRFAFRKLTR